MRHPRWLALLAILAMLTVACGSRLSPQERAQAIAALTAGTGGSGGTEFLGVEDPTPVDTDFTTDGGAVTAGPQNGAETRAQEGAGPAAAEAGAADCPPATTASDTGVTPNAINIATLADISGVQPGLFQAAHQAARAATAYINSQGGICGRRINPLLLDSRTDAGGNRAAMLEACDRAFAVVGSMSAFDDGSAAPGEACGIPDMSAITTNRPKVSASNVFPMAANATGLVATTAADYVVRNHPEAAQNAAILWLNQAVTKNNAQERKAAWEAAGMRFVYTAETQVLEANYTRFVQEMRSNNVQYVTMVSDFQSVVRLQRAMRQQNYVPQFRGWDSVVYDPDYLQEGDVVEGSTVFLNTAMFEEAAGNPEMQLYIEWLGRASPGATPNYFGLYSWSAYRLFQKLATEIGPDLTRAKMLAALRATGEWDAHGLHAPHLIGQKQLSVCNLYAHVRGGQFVRFHPASGFDCNGRNVRAS